MGALLSTCRWIASWVTCLMNRCCKTKDQNEDESTLLGDVWDESTVQEAYQNGLIRSIPNDTSTTTSTLQVTFTNESPTQDLILCWISPHGDLHHYYKLPCQGGSHCEMTHEGDAFGLFLSIPQQQQQGGGEDNNSKDDSDDEETGSFLRPSSSSSLSHGKTIIAAYRPKTKEQRGEHHSIVLRHNESNNNNSNHHYHLRGRRRSNKKQKLAGWTLTVTNNNTNKKPTKVTPMDTSKKHYEKQQYGIWTTYCEPGCWESSSHLEAIFQMDLDEVTKRLPDHVRQVLSQSTHIYMNTSHRYAEQIDNPVGCYHPGKQWLLHHGMNPEKEGHVEFYNVHNYTHHRRLWGTGGILLHELCHAYHHKHLPNGYHNQDILDCYEAAMNEGLYDQVPYHSAVMIDGGGCKNPQEITNQKLQYTIQTAKHYACSNAQEYFAELSVAFLSSPSLLLSSEEQGEDGVTTTKAGEQQQQKEEEEYNKWYPYNASQLKEHDPRAFKLLQELWGSNTT
jgi:hypothetical protein